MKNLWNKIRPSRLEDVGNPGVRVALYEEKGILLAFSIKVWLLSATTLLGANPSFTPTPTNSNTPTATGGTATMTFTPTVTLVPSQGMTLLTSTITSTPTNSFTTTPTGIGTGMNTFTPTPTPTIVGTFAYYTTSPTPSSTAGCVSYFDNFQNSNTLSNYDYFMNSSQALTTALGAGYQIAGGYFLVSPPAGGNNGGMAVVDNSLFSHSLSDYTVEADFEMDSLAGGMGVFGIAFRTGTNGSFYCFQWNGNPSNADGGTPNWQIEKNSGSPLVSFSYPGCCLSAPAYTFGSWVHMKVVCAGNQFLCYLNLNDGVGDRLMYNVTDNSAPFVNGGVGVRTYGIFNPNVVRIDNFQVNSCGASLAPSVTLTASSSPTATGTQTLAGSFTATPTPTSTVTNTPSITSGISQPTFTPSPSSTLPITVTFVPSVGTATADWTATPTPSATPTSTPSLTVTFSPVVSVTPVSTNVISNYGCFAESGDGQDLLTTGQPAPHYSGGDGALDHALRSAMDIGQPQRDRPRSTPPPSSTLPGASNCPRSSPLTASSPFLSRRMMRSNSY